MGEAALEDPVEGRREVVQARPGLGTETAMMNRLWFKCKKLREMPISTNAVSL